MVPALFSLRTRPARPDEGPARDRAPSVAHVVAGLGLRRGDLRAHRARVLIPTSSRSSFIPTGMVTASSWETRHTRKSRRRSPSSRRSPLRRSRSTAIPTAKSRNGPPRREVHWTPRASCLQRRRPQSAAGAAGRMGSRRTRRTGDGAGVHCRRHAIATVVLGPGSGGGRQRRIRKQRRRRRARDP